VDIAKALGCSRQTLYNHLKSANITVERKMSRYEMLESSYHTHYNNSRSPCQQHHETRTDQLELGPGDIEPNFPNEMTQRSGKEILEYL
ncbi:MAG TPA: hypothetical protein VGO47_09715, partial [Chlamydiales bacterium]|nr:hypothetical protein [Chlamydiales bacterium]